LAAKAVLADRLAAHFRNLETTNKMSWLSVIGKIFTGVQTATNAIAPVAPIIEAIPTVGGIFGVIFNTVVQVESLVPQPGKGADVKKPVATTLINAQVPGLDQAQLSAAIDSLVAALNSMQKAAPAEKAA
jgi:hypothetical protein